MKFGICVCERCWPDFFSCNISPQSYSGFINYIGNTVLSLPLISESLCIIGLISSLNLIDKYNEEDIEADPFNIIWLGTIELNTANEGERTLS